MLNSFRKTLLTGVVAFVIGASGPVVAAEFNDAQRSELGNIIRDYLMQNPEVLRDAFQELQRREQVAEAERAKTSIREHASNLFRSSDDLVMGNPDGKVTLVEYFDYNCGYCKRAMPDVLKLLDDDKDVKIVMKEFPILGPGSTFAARAALASKKQGKYADFHVALMQLRGAANEQSVMRVADKVGLDTSQLKKDMEAPEIDRILTQNAVVAQSLGINGTPAFVIDETLIPGAVGYETLAGTVDQVRQDGCKLC